MRKLSPITFILFIILTTALSCAIEEPKECVNETYKCVSDTQSSRCTYHQWQPPIDCAKTGGYCDEKTKQCRDPQESENCTTTNTVCIGTELHTCIVDKPVHIEECEWGCDEQTGKCKPSQGPNGLENCTTTNTVCIGNEQHTCVVDKPVYIEECEWGCDEQTGKCMTPECSFTQDICDETGNAILHCDDEGKLSKTQCHSETTCIDAQCICKENGIFCYDDKNYLECQANKLGELKACPNNGYCHINQCYPEQCGNAKRDLGEIAVDCGGICPACIDCYKDEDCQIEGSSFDFCDSAAGYVCSKRCRNDLDCRDSHALAGEYCRNDGRCSSKAFKFVWETYEEGQVLTLPYRDIEEYSQCHFRILWGDEPTPLNILDQHPITDCQVETNRQHKYAEAGQYIVEIHGVYDGFGDSAIVKEVLSFGPVGLAGNFLAQGTVKLPVRDIPDATKLIYMDNMFAHLSTFNEPLQHWDTRNVTSMARSLADCYRFNQPLGKWNTSKVTDMTSMFVRSLFDQPIERWDTSQVESTAGMFSSTPFNKPIDAWDMRNVTNMRSMFHQTSQFNQTIEGWNTESVKDMSMMFYQAMQFDQPLANWDIRNVISMDHMFFGATQFNQDLSAWIPSALESAIAPFTNSGMSEEYYCELANSPLWDPFTLGLSYPCNP